jgi:hypothetical protein
MAPTHCIEGVNGESGAHRKMAKIAKFYAVRHGRSTGVFESWEACERQVKGFVYRRPLSTRHAYSRVRGHQVLCLHT